MKLIHIILSDCIFFLFIAMVIYFIGYATRCVLNYETLYNSLSFLITLRFVLWVVTIGVGIIAIYVVISYIKSVWNHWKNFNKLEAKEKLREN